MEYGFVSIVLVVLLARKLGYDWQAGGPGLRSGLVIFFAATVLQAFASGIEDHEVARNFDAAAHVAIGLGWVQVVRGVFAIGRHTPE